MSLDILSLALGALVASLLTALVLMLKAKNDRLVLEAEKARLEERLEAEAKAHEAKLASYEDARKQVENSFKAMAADTLKDNGAQFLTLAQQTLAKFQQGASTDLEQRQKAISDLIAPLNEKLTQYDTQLHQIEKARAGAYGELMTQIATMHKGHEELRRQTDNLVRALRTPQGRGRWGEMQLRRVVEMAGMLDHVDFIEQVAGDTKRPDMIIKLPNERCIIVDSKVPIDAFMDVVNQELDDDSRMQAMDRHARHVREHLRGLGSKAYWREYSQYSPDFVIMFLPDEGLFSTALQKDPSLIEQGVSDHVIPASPTTLIAMLRAVAYGWQQQRLTEEAREMGELARDLYDRLAAFGSHMSKLGKQLRLSVDSYNGAVGSLERNVLPQARKIEKVHSVLEKKKLAELSAVEEPVRSLTAAECTDVMTADQPETEAARKQA